MELSTKGPGILDLAMEIRLSIFSYVLGDFIQVALMCSCGPRRRPKKTSDDYVQDPALNDRLSLGLVCRLFAAESVSVRPSYLVADSCSAACMEKLRLEWEACSKAWLEGPESEEDSDEEREDEEDGVDDDEDDDEDGDSDDDDGDEDEDEDEEDRKN